MHVSYGGSIFIPPPPPPNQDQTSKYFQQNTLAWEWTVFVTVEDRP